MSASIFFGFVHWAFSRENPVPSFGAHRRGSCLLLSIWAAPVILFIAWVSPDLEILPSLVSVRSKGLFFFAPERSRTHLGFSVPAGSRSRFLHRPLSFRSPPVSHEGGRQRRQIFPALRSLSRALSRWFRVLAAMTASCFASPAGFHFMILRSVWCCNPTRESLFSFICFGFTDAGRFQFSCPRVCYSLSARFAQRRLIRFLIRVVPVNPVLFLSHRFKGLSFFIIRYDFEVNSCSCTRGVW
jgi:hypothetical protein